MYPNGIRDGTVVYEGEDNRDGAAGINQTVARLIPAKPEAK